jgi:ribosome maturation factor RimP
VTQADGAVTGRIVANTDTAVTLDVDGEHRDLAFADIAKAVVQVEMNRKDVAPDLDDDEDN